MISLSFSGSTRVDMVGELVVGWSSGLVGFDSQEGQKDLESKSWGVETAGLYVIFSSYIAGGNSFFFYYIKKYVSLSKKKTNIEE